MLNLDQPNRYATLKFCLIRRRILRNNSYERSYKWFILSAFLAQHTITRKLSRSIFKIREGGCAKIHPDCIYKFQASRLSHRAARTCKYEFLVFARFQLCNALSHGNTKSTGVQNDVETSTNTRTVEQGLYRRMDRSGFAVEPRINRRCGKADMRCFAYDRLPCPRISDVVRAPVEFAPAKISKETRPISFQNYRQSPFFFPLFLFRAGNFRLRKGVKSPKRRLFMLAHEKARISSRYVSFIVRHIRRYIRNSEVLFFLLQQQHGKIK